MDNLKFPKNFFWGAATSAHQVEGGNVNDWSEWEKNNAERLAKEAKTKWLSWQQEKFPEMFEAQNYISGAACDHYNRYEGDFDIAKSLNHNAHRFSIEWSRVEPEEGKFNEEAIEHYRKVILALRVRGIEPFVTLWHWPMPLWLRDQGGWQNKKIIEYFSRYSKKIIEQMGADVKFWITQNETNVYTGKGYLEGKWSPGFKSLTKYLRVNHHLSQAHMVAFDTIKKINPSAQIGVAHNVVYFSKISAGIKKYIYNRLYLNSVSKYQDFVGINYYLSDRRLKERSDMGWSTDKDGLYFVLKDASSYRKPIYIFENGIADALDTKRAQFIKDHISAMKKALDEGVDVRGYFYWSLIDNFEWDKGFWPRFGLVEINYKTQERKIRPSAWEYAKICKNNSLET